MPPYGLVSVATLRAQVVLSLFTDFEKFTTFTPDVRHERDLIAMFNVQPLGSGHGTSDARAAREFVP